jgi:hypothetical protein
MYHIEWRSEDLSQKSKMAELYIPYLKHGMLQAPDISGYSAKAIQVVAKMVPGCYALCVFLGRDSTVDHK